MTPVHAAVGNINIDIYLDVPRLPGPDDEVAARESAIKPGGAASNYAVAVCRAGHRARLVAHTTLVAEALRILEHLRSEGVDTSSVRVHGEGEPGIVVILHLPSGESSMVKVRGVNALLSGGDVAAAKPFDVVHFASVPPRVVTEAEPHLVGAKLVSYDPGGAVVAEHQWRVVEAARRAVNVLTLNLREADALLGGFTPARARELLGGKLSMVLVRCGEAGSYLVMRGRVLWVQAYRAGEVVDTTGAGDTFNAYFNAMLVEGRSLEEALAAASVAAGIKVTRLGAQEAPRRSEVLPRIGEVRVEEILREE